MIGPLQKLVLGDIDLRVGYVRFAELRKHSSEEEQAQKDSWHVTLACTYNLQVGLIGNLQKGTQHYRSCLETPDPCNFREGLVTVPDWT